MPDDFDYSQPRRAANRASPQPLITQALCVLCVLITISYWTAPDSMRGTAWYAFGHFGVQSAPDIWDGRYYALFTSFFTHLGIAHLVFNMMWLLRLGSVLELTVSPLIYLLFLVGAAFVGSCAELAITGQTGAGASGVVYAMFGLLWAGRGSYAPWRNIATRENLNLFVLWGIFCVVMTVTHLMPVANGAHGGGFVFGLAIGWLFYAPRRRPLWAIPLALLGVLCVMSLTWLPWSWSWAWYKGDKAYNHARYQQAIFWYQRSLRTGGEPRPLWKNIGLAWLNIAEAAQEKNDLKAAQAALQQAEQAQAQSDSVSEPEAPAETNPLDEIKKQIAHPKAQTGDKP